MQRKPATTRKVAVVVIKTMISTRRPPKKVVVAVGGETEEVKATAPRPTIKRREREYTINRKKRGLLHAEEPSFFYIWLIDYSPNVATITALIVCILFSASSNTIEFSDSKTSSVTSTPSRPNCL